MKIALTVILCFFSVFTHSPLRAESRDGAAGSRTADRAAQPIGFWESRPHWGRDGDQQENSKRLDSGWRRIAPNHPLVLGITAGAAPRRAAALRFAEKGRRLLMAGGYQRALMYFEKALGLDSNPYFYYYLARTHYQLAHTQESLRFLDVAQSLLSDQSDWVVAVNTLRAKFQGAARTSRVGVQPIALPSR